MAIILILGLLILGFLIYKHRSKKERLSEVEKPREQPPEKHLPISRGKVVRPRDYEDYNKFQRDVFQRARLLAHLDRYEESLNQLQFFYNGVKKFKKYMNMGVQILKIIFLP